MSDPGALDITKLEQLEADIASEAARKAADKKARSEEEAREGVSRAALLMRQRRKRPDIKSQERKAIQARDKAMRTLAKAHPEEFMVYVQEERKTLGLDPLQPRGKHRRTLEQRAHENDAPTPARPAPRPAQEKCRHADHPIKKLPYGNFCGGCGKRI